jgi:hypothetical protein
MILMKPIHTLYYNEALYYNYLLQVMLCIIMKPIHASPMLCIIRAQIIMKAIHVQKTYNAQMLLLYYQTQVSVEHSIRNSLEHSIRNSLEHSIRNSL